MRCKLQIADCGLGKIFLTAVILSAVTAVTAIAGDKIIGEELAIAVDERLIPKDMTAEMTMTNVDPVIRGRIKSIVVREFGGIDHLPDDIMALRDV